MHAKLISVMVAGLIALPLMGCETSGPKTQQPTDVSGSTTGETKTSLMGDGMAAGDHAAPMSTEAKDAMAATGAKTAARPDGTVYRDSTGKEVFLFSGTPTADDLLAQLTEGDKTRQIVFLGQTEQQPASACAAQFKSGKTLGLNITFALNSATLTDEAKQQLDNVAELLQRYDCLEFSISGHTDKSGNPRINKPLSERRAQAVRDYLVQKEGIAPDRFSTAGYGSDRLLQDLPETDPRNRRVEFTIS